MLSNAKITETLTIRIKEILAETRFSDVPIIDADITEPIIRPSIKFKIENADIGNFNSSSTEKNVEVRIYFFATDRVKTTFENDEMQDILSAGLLEGIYVEEDFYIPIDDIECTVSDGVLIITIDLEVIEELNGPEVELMEELSYR